MPEIIRLDMTPKELLYLDQMIFVAWANAKHANHEPLDRETVSRTAKALLEMIEDTKAFRILTHRLAALSIKYSEDVV